MLVLTRKSNETINVYHDDFDIEIEVLEIKGNKVRLGISASSNITVDRNEVYLKKK